MSGLGESECVACAGKLTPIGQVGGYVEGEAFTVLECRSCRTQAVYPRTIPCGLYDAIYLNADRIDGGYDRYLRYASGTSVASSPLHWLAEQEDMYWGVSTLLDLFPLRHNARIVEVGCGLGYFTYALVKAGYHGHGIDLSDVAIRSARSRFGNHFSVEDAAVSARVKHADAIVALELLEHLPDPAAFLRSVRANMSPTACLIVSTPNRDTYPYDSLWNTDLPPVHLQWFSEKGIQVLAQRTGFAVSFADFSSRNSGRMVTPWVASAGYRNPRFTEALTAIPRKTHHESLAKRALRKLKSLASAPLWMARRTTDDVKVHRLGGSRSIAMVCRLTPVSAS